MHNLNDLTQQLLDAAKSAGADGADTIAISGTSVSIDVREGKLEQAERSEGIDLGLRVFVGQTQACVSASDTNPDTLTQMAQRAVAMAKESPEDPHIGLASADMLSKVRSADDLEIFDPTDEPSAALLQENAQEAEAAAMSVDGISQVQAATGAYSRRQIHLATSNGFSGGYSRTDRAISCVAISGSGLEMERDYDSDVRIFQDDLRSASEVGKAAAERAVARSGARKPPTGSFPVLYDERVSSGLISHLLGAANGSGIARGSSWLREAMGTQVLPKGLSIIEDPHRKRASGSRPFDAEGLRTAKRAIVEDGILMGWTLDLATGRKLGMESTANAQRGTSSPPSPGLGNVALTQGTATRDELLAQMGTGLLVTSLIGSSINPTTGDYSRGASGYWVENGEITYPVNECTIAGNLHDMLRNLVPANDARTHLSRVVPSLLVEGLTLAGE